MSNYLPGINFPIYSGWNQYTPVIPKMYWDAYSIEQIIKQLCCNFDKCQHYLDYVANIINEWGIEFDEEMEAQLTAMWEQINNGYKDAISKWIVNDLPDIIAAAIKMVFFGLTEDGYFCAWVPKSWQGILFDTIADYNNENYGCLTLAY